MRFKVRKRQRDNLMTEYIGSAYLSNTLRERQRELCECELYS